ncbi:MAG: NADPH-dependent 7-cyano-7-deazaguanine reductase QueF [Proteobacteria bacterium]|nr:NADPH-dependent 7-cyano-7-deazaguanine reductase QueF [Pseudomonadota bacterium]
MNPADHSPLGKPVPWPACHDPALLFAIARASGRSGLPLGVDSFPFIGHDQWTAYELSWVDALGKPQVAIARLQVPADSPSLIESKSLKLYLGGFAMVAMASAEAVRALIAGDLSAAAGAAVAVELLPVVGATPVRELDGQCIDDQPIAIVDHAGPAPEHLHVHADHVEETLLSHLFRSNCPVTGQPDWASVQIGYRGPRIDRAGLLRYLVSFRRHSGFHEQCVERIFLDLRAHCRPDALSVYARYTRRGGIDINPWRATPGMPDPAPARCARQ